MKILFDHQAFDYQNHGGVSRYFSELITELQKMPDVTTELALRYTDNVHLGNGELYRSKNIFQSNNWVLQKSGKVISSYLNEFNSAKTLLKGDYDIFHAGYFYPYFWYFLPKNKPYTLMVHDMTHEKFPEYFNRWSDFSRLKKLHCEKAAHILTNSENTKKDLVEMLQLNPEKVSVTPLSGGLVATEIGKKILPQLPKNYLLYVGSRKEYKNFDTFLKAMTPILQQRKDLQILCVGGAFTATEKAIFEKSNVDKQLHQLSPNDTELYYCYQNALCFVYPSRYEGFGIPVLEAMSADCPCVLSNVGALQEVGSDSALYFDPLSENDMQKTILSIIDNQEFKTALIQKGKERIKEFSWQKTAEKTLLAYQKINISIG